VKFTKSYQGRTIKSKVGLSVNFTWTFSGDVGAVDWGIKRAGVTNDFESNGKILSLNKNGAQTFLNPGYVSRVTGSRSGNLKSGEVFFSLNAISKQDANHYLCILRAGFGLSDQYDDVQLIVEEIPIITHPESGKVTYRESEAVSISCKTSGKPVPYVSWIHNGRVKNSGSKTATLNFSSISKADAGSYTCKANNSAGITEKQLILLVNCKYHMTHSFV
ncbi:unnamed protein product, partial [Porites evermanni]